MKTVYSQTISEYISLIETAAANNNVTLLECLQYAVAGYLHALTDAKIISAQESARINAETRSLWQLLNLD